MANIPPRRARGNLPYTPKRLNPKPPLLGKPIAGPEGKATTIAGIQARSLTSRKKPITLWKPNLPNYDDEDHD